MLLLLLRFASALAMCACVWFAMVGHSKEWMCGAKRESIVCFATVNGSQDVEIRLTRRVFQLAHAICIIADENNSTVWQYADKHLPGLHTLRHTLSLHLHPACQFADREWFGMQHLRDTLYRRFDALAEPRMETIQEDIEESMHLAAVQAFRNHFHDMTVVAEETADEKQMGMRKVSQALDKTIESVILSTETATLVGRSKYNALWTSDANNGITMPQTWAFVAKELSARKNDWMHTMEAECDKIRKQLSSFNTLHVEMRTRFAKPQMPEPTDSEKWSQFATEMFVLLGSIRVLAWFA